MASLADFETESIKMLYPGKPGTGKTGSLISILLADPEARLFIANYDGGNIGTLANVARNDPTTGQPRPPEVVADLLSRIQFHSFADQIKSINGVTMVTGVPTAFHDLGRKLNDWGDGYGGLSSWGPKDWFVLDSFSALCDAALRYSLNNGGRLNKRPEQSDWGDAINRLILILQMINDPSVKANVCVITHIRYVGDLDGAIGTDGKPKELEALPNALGQKLPQEIGRFFNNIILAATSGTGPALQRKIYTRSPGKLELRTSNPGVVKPEYPIGTGMADLIKDLRRKGVAALSAPTPTPVATTPAAASTASV
ncbi:putative helicase [Caulobacter phage Kuura]|nr:putative helicase [Caulobacter phage Kuura]